MVGMGQIREREKSSCDADPAVVSAIPTGSPTLEWPFRADPKLGQDGQTVIFLCKGWILDLVSHLAGRQNNSRPWRRSLTGLIAENSLPPAFLVAGINPSLQGHSVVISQCPPQSRAGHWSSLSNPFVCHRFFSSLSTILPVLVIMTLNILMYFSFHYPLSFWYNLCLFLLLLSLA